MNIILVLVVVLAAAVFLWLVFSKKRGAQKAVAYECPQCGELHCDCYQKDETQPTDRE